jgi:hypothetical protein
MPDTGLLISDAVDLLGSLITPPWGVYLNGTPVIQPATPFGNAISTFLQPVEEVASLVGFPNIVPVSASTVEFAFAEDWPLSNYPQEQGAFQTYDKVTLPFDVKLRLASGGTESNRQAFLQSCLAIANSFALFDIVTPELVFTSTNATHISWRRTALEGVGLIVVELWFQQISVSGMQSFANTQTPGIAGQQSIGNVQPYTPTAAQSQLLSGEIS